MSDTNFHFLTISDIQPETDNAVCISFHVPESLRSTFHFTQGQFLTLEAEFDGEPLRRSYSISSGINEDNLKIGVRRVTNGKFSNYANDCLQPGDTVKVMPPQGSFFSDLDPKHKKRYMCLAVGSGITPMLSIIKSVLDAEADSHITLIYGNRRSDTVMFKEELSFLKNRHMSRFQWINILSQEDQGTDLLNGKIDNKKGFLLHKHNLIDIHNTDEAFICGPEAMMSEVSRGFRIEGLKEEKIHYELFASSSDDSQQRLKRAAERVKEYGEEKSSKVTLTADGRSIQFNLATAGENILDAGLNNGMELPYSCKAGVCSTCKAKLIKGEVDMDLNHGLESHEVEAGYILSCQAHPLSDEVVVDFDQR